MVITAARTALRFLPDSLRFGLVRRLVARTNRPKYSAAAIEASRAARRVEYAPGRVLWSWGQGPAILFVHGWNGHALQFASIAEQAASRGFQCLAVDVGGHGESAGRRTGWDFFMRDIVAAVAVAGAPVHALVGHSAGALTAMALRRQGRILSRRYVLVSAPTYPFPATDAIRRKLAPGEKVIARYQSYVASQFETEWDRMRAAEFFQSVQEPMLLCYDSDDAVVPSSEARRIQGACPHAELLLTRGYRHNGILSANEVVARVVDFVSESSPAGTNVSSRWAAELPARRDGQ